MLQINKEEIRMLLRNKRFASSILIKRLTGRIESNTGTGQCFKGFKKYESKSF